MEEIQNTEINQDIEKSEIPQKKRKKIFAFLIRWSFRLFLIFLSFLIALGIALQIPGVRSEIARFGVNIANSFLLAKIELDDLQFHSLSVIELNGSEGNYCWRYFSLDKKNLRRCRFTASIKR